MSPKVQMMYRMSPPIVGDLVDKYMEVGSPRGRPANKIANKFQILNTSIISLLSVYYYPPPPPPPVCCQTHGFLNHKACILYNAI